MPRIQHIHDLDLEIERTKLQLERVENRIDQNISDLKSNYRLMALNSLLTPERQERIFNFLEKIGSRLWSKFS